MPSICLLQWVSSFRTKSSVDESAKSWHEQWLTTGDGSHIFSSEPLKHGISLAYVMIKTNHPISSNSHRPATAYKVKHFLKWGGWFHLRRLSRAERNAGRELQNERCERAKHCATRSDIYWVLKSWPPKLPECAIKIYLNLVVDIVKRFVVYYILWTPYSPQTSLLV